MISIVIPALNEQDTIGACLASVAAQDFDGDVEVIVVDNGSTDDTAEIAHRAGAIVVLEQVRGVCSARQAGTAVARGDIVVSTDADTVFAPDWLSRIVRSMNSDTSPVATCGPCHFVDGPWWSTAYTRALFGGVAWFHKRTGRVLYASATNIAFRRTAWTGYDVALTQGGDELGLLRDLRRRGAIDFDLSRMTYTSSRRLTRGLLYSVFVTCIFFYLGAYFVNRWTGRTVLGSAPAIRGGAPHRATRRQRRAIVGATAVALLGLAWWLTPVDVV